MFVIHAQEKRLLSYTFYARLFFLLDSGPTRRHVRLDSVLPIVCAARPTGAVAALRGFEVWWTGEIENTGKTRVNLLFTGMVHVESYL